MADMTLTLTGPLLKPEYQTMTPEAVVTDYLHTLVKRVTEALTKAIKEKIEFEINRSTQLAAYVGQHADPEVVRIITQSIKVESDGQWPPSISIEYKDDLKSLHGDAPPELMDMLNSIIEKSLSLIDADIDKIGEEAIRDKG